MTAWQLEYLVEEVAECAAVGEILGYAVDAGVDRAKGS
jgi:hypothetical protein